ncbi:MAG: AMP-binding protein [Gemmatimonadetes bacterium]|nr:AMP-binding protein [Gemmatimonadota bacterium]
MPSTMVPEAHAVVNANVALLLWRAAERQGGSPAIVERDGEASYADLLARAAAVATTLVAAGVGPGDPVAILLERGTGAVAAFFGALAVGAIAVLMDEAVRPRQIEHVLTHSGARFLLTTRDLLARQPRSIRTTARILDLRAVRPARGAVPPPVTRGSRDVAQIIYTSGSTGMPKGVVVSHGNLQAATGAVTSYLGITGADRIASLLPFSFVYGMSQLLCTVSASATLIVERSPLPQQIAARLLTARITVLPAVPSLWIRLLQTPGFRAASFPALRAMTNAGGHLPVEAVRALRRAQPAARLYLMYGLTEALRSTYLPPEEVDRRPDSIGRAIPGAEVYVVRQDGTPATRGEIGELVHRGPTVTLGYWKDAELTARVFRPNPAPGATAGERVVFSGDLVRRDAEGFLYFVGRKDRIIKSMGYRVGPDEVADVLHASGEVTEVEVLGEPDQRWGARIVAHVVLAPGGSLERLKAFCTREMPRYLRPSRIEARRELPLLANGKHDVAALKNAPRETV